MQDLPKWVRGDTTQGQKMRGSFLRVRIQVVQVLRSIGFKNFLRLALKLAHTKLLSLKILTRSDQEYRQIDEGKLGAQSLYRDFDGDGMGGCQPAVMPVGVWELSSVKVYLNTKFPAVRRGNELLLTPRVEPGPYHLYENEKWTSNFQLFGPLGGRYLAKEPEDSLSIECGIYVGTRSPKNWSHWLINFLPAVMIASDYFGSQLPGPLIVPENYASGESRRELFNLFWANRPVLELSHSSSVSLDRLFWFEQPFSDSPRPKFRENLRPKMANLPLMSNFRDRVLEYSRRNHTVDTKPSRIFLSREVGYDRPYNTLEVDQIALSAGYQPVYLNRLPIADQVAIISNADKIVGPHGSALANVIFSKPGAKVLELGNRISRIEHWDAPLAEVAGAEMYLTYSTVDGDDPRREFDINLARLFEILSDF